MVKVRELSYEERLTVKVLRETGLSFPKIGKIVGCHHTTALRIYKNFLKTASVAKLPRTGRTKKFDERDERAVCRRARKLRFNTLEDISRDVATSFYDNKTSKYHIRRILSKYGINSRIRKRKPFLSVGNRKHQITWSRNLIHWAADQWEQIVFSDECRFGLKNDAMSLRIWRTSAEANDPRYFQPTFKNSVSVMFWGCIGPNGVGRLVLCEDSVNATKYIAILQNNLLQSVEKMFGDDGRPFIF